MTTVYLYFSAIIYKLISRTEMILSLSFIKEFTNYQANFDTHEMITFSQI